MYVLLCDDVGGGGCEYFGVVLCDDGQFGFGLYVDFKIDFVVSYQFVVVGEQEDQYVFIFGWL